MAASKGTAWCAVCQMALPSEADLAIHEFSDKHSKNLCRQAKNQPIPIKEKKNEGAIKKDEDKLPLKTASAAGVSQYGYFAVGEVTTNKDVYAPKPYNYDYEKLAALKPPPPPPQEPTPVKTPTTKSSIPSLLLPPPPPPPLLTTTTTGTTTATTNIISATSVTTSTCTTPSTSTNSTVPSTTTSLQSGYVYNPYYAYYAGQVPYAPTAVTQSQVTYKQGQVTYTQTQSASPQVTTASAAGGTTPSAAVAPYPYSGYPYPTYPGYSYPVVQDPTAVTTTPTPVITAGTAAAMSQQSVYTQGPSLYTPEEIQAMNTTPVTSVTSTSQASFSHGKKKKVRYCQICNVSLKTVPEYEAHMRSGDHVMRLRTTGMGVNAHFVRASADLHTIDVSVSEPKSTEGVVTIVGAPVMAKRIPMSPLELYCDVCEVQLNSVPQYESHMTGNPHKERLKKKEKKGVHISSTTITATGSSAVSSTGPPVGNPNVLYCYTCKISVTDVAQFNMHKNGKKHAQKCRNLVRMGITIPPEERPPKMRLPMIDEANAIYPEYYEKCVLEPQREKLAEEARKLEQAKALAEISLVTTTTLAPQIVFHTGEEGEEKPKEETSFSDSIIGPTLAAFEEAKKAEPDSTTVQEDTKLKCNICREIFDDMGSFNCHLNGEEHARTVLKCILLPTVYQSPQELLQQMTDDRKQMLADFYGHRYCGVCDVTLNTDSEYALHLINPLHKAGLNEFQKKKEYEIQLPAIDNEDGSFRCHFCPNIFEQVIKYNEHLHSADHRAKAKAKRLAMMRGMGYRRIYGRGFGYGYGYSYHHRWGGEVNPGVRTKVTGVVRDLVTGAVDSVDNIEEVEPKIDEKKNVDVGFSTSPGGTPPIRGGFRGMRPFRGRGGRMPPFFSPRGPFGPRGPYRPRFCPPPNPLDNPDMDRPLWGPDGGPADVEQSEEWTGDGPCDNFEGDSDEPPIKRERTDIPPFEPVIPWAGPGRGRGVPWGPARGRGRPPFPRGGF